MCGLGWVHCVPTQQKMIHKDHTKYDNSFSFRQFTRVLNIRSHNTAVFRERETEAEGEEIIHSGVTLTLL